jgi:hypothetical protein
MWYIISVRRKRKFPKGMDRESEALERQGKRVPAIFFRTDAGGEPVRDWLKGLPSPEDRKRIGQDIKTVEFGWPFASLWAMAFMKCGRAWPRIASLGCFSTSMRRAGWSCYTGSSRRPERLLTKI